MKSDYFLSVVIPVFNQWCELSESLKKIVKYLKKRKYSWEIIIVDDGSTNQAPEDVRQFIDSYPNIKIVANIKNEGKGSAVRKGVLKSKGKYILVTDADLSTPIEEIDRFLDFVGKGYPVVIGSRGLPGSRIVEHQQWYREKMGKIFNLMVRILFGLPFKDTQCGFKLFRNSEARKIFIKQTIRGFAFDVEILYLAKKANIKIKEIPVTWWNSPNSTVHIIKGTLSMLQELFKIKTNIWRRVYK